MVLRKPDASDSVTTTFVNTKMGEVENKVRNVSGLVTTTVPDTEIGKVEKKIPNVGSLVNKTDYDAKISDNKTKCFTNSDYNKFMGDMLDANIKQEELVDKMILIIS